MKGGDKRRVPLNVLLAEDDPNDRKLLRAALARDGVDARLFVVGDGGEVLEYLRGEEKFGDRSKYPIPDLMVLDLKMPRLDGLEVLKWVRAHPSCGSMPIVMLSGSGLEKDVNEAYRSGANSYFTKPNSVNDLSALLRAVATYWQLTERPSRADKCG